ncbi:MAG TPA: hypothetical protein VK021_06315 [Flavobacteriaceae bacterium]|nr:hypothetical protein [Flavobacteriaceae bacterium]
MKETFERLSKITAPVCVTLILKTHKVHPDNKKDVILLKNKIAEANQRLQSEYGEEIAERYTEKLEKLAEDIDYRHNDHGLMLFVNDDIAEFLRLPIKLNSRIILDDTFATRPIVRALHRSSNYYILVISKGKARMLQASSDTLEEEFTTGGFPVEDPDLLGLIKATPSKATRVTNLTKEFFNRVDKMANNIRRKNPLNVIICSDESNYHDYMKIADNPNTILGYIPLKKFNETADNLVRKVWPKVEELILKKNRSRIEELKQAISSGNYLGDLNDIWQAVQKGRGRTIFVEERYFQPVRNEDGILTPISTEDIKDKNDINDIVDDMIEYTLEFGGDAVFLEEGSLENFNKIALVTRY